VKIVFLAAALFLPAALGAQTVVLDTGGFDAAKLTTDCVRQILTNTMAGLTRAIQAEVTAAVERRVLLRVQDRIASRLEERVEQRIEAKIERRLEEKLAY
jgi:hypothetical protein